MNAKIKKVLFFLTFIPYAIVPLNGLHVAVFGGYFFFNPVYGVDGFWLGIICALYAMVVEIPVIPVCIVFHLLCLLRRTVPFIRNTSTKAFALICGAACLTVFISLFIRFNPFVIEQIFQKTNAKLMSVRADEKIAYKKGTTIYEGIFNMPEYKTNHILIDYDKNDVGFLTYAGYDQYYEIHLAETSPDSPEYRYIADTYFVQSDIPLSSPGKRLVSFSDERYRQYTVALLLFFEDGTIFCADGIRYEDTDRGQYFGLDNNPQELIRLEDSEKK